MKKVEGKSFTTTKEEQIYFYASPTTRSPKKIPCLR